MSKISIIGAGAVGATTAFLLSEAPWVSEIVIVDIDNNRAKGNALDIMHGISLSQHIKVVAGGYEDTKNSDITIITIGVPEKVGESRLVPLQKNTDILQEIVPQIVSNSPNGYILVVSNPVDILAYITYKLSGLAHERVLGLGTLLDSSRLNYLLSRDFGISSDCIEATVVGEHGDTQVVLWSQTTIGGLSVEEYAKIEGITLEKDYKEKIASEVKDTAFDVWQMKGPNCYCVAMAIRKVVQTIVRGEKQVLTVSNLYRNENGVQEMYLSQPSIVSARGVEKQLLVPMDEDEKKKMEHSFTTLSDIIKQINF